MPDELDFLDELPAHLPDRLVEEAERINGGPVACYVVDIGGTELRRVSGAAGLPRTIPLRTAIGPEFGIEGLAELRGELDAMVSGAVVAPLWLRGRATAMLVAAQGDLGGLERVARRSAAAVELSSGYTDVIERARRLRPATAAAEMQQDMLSPRLAAVTGGRIAGSLLPAYDVGGDWFDHAENPEGVWLAVADAMGRGTRAAAVSVVAMGSVRAARRAGASLEECCAAVDEAIAGLDGDAFVTAVLANWQPSTHTFTWINCGHPPPLLVGRGGEVSELVGEGTHPFGLWSDGRSGFVRNQRRLEVGDRVMMYSDGVTDRRTHADEFIGLDGLIALLRGLGSASAAQVVIAVERHLLAATENELADDATQLVFEVTA